ncbi:MAG: hypothetical protein IPN84_17755 [Sphingomonadales bacterium]|nr:hypothetical protein [Sphingomonadales bacterium]
MFVFGSNLAGRHGKGAPSGRGPTGCGSMAADWSPGSFYAIPTKDRHLRTLPIAAIARHVDEFIIYAAEQPQLSFQLTPIGCGLAGYRHEQIAPLFDAASANIVIPPEFAGYLTRAAA